MKQWTPWIAGFAVAVGVGALLGFLGAATGADLGVSATILPMTLGGLTAYLLFNLSGNRAVRAADAATREAALQFQPAPSQAALYVYRTGFAGRAAGMSVAIDGRPFTQIKSPCFSRIDIAPGAHTLRAFFEGGAGAQSNPAEHAFTAQAGEVLIFKLGYAMGAVKNTLKIETAAPDVARRDMRNAKMILTESA